MTTSATSIRLVVFDWAGTTIDHGCFGPVAAFVQTFAQHGVQVSAAEARGPMGLHKGDHLRVLLAMPEIAARWHHVHGRDWTEQDVAQLYQEFMPRQLKVIGEHSRLVPGLVECVAELRRAGVVLGATTGYFRAAAEQVYQKARAQGFVPDHSVCAEEVAEGRPAPWMIYRVMEHLKLYPPAAVVKVGDTVPDIQEGLSAGAWSVGVTRTSSEVGCTEEELTALSPEERRRRLSAARTKLLAAGAHTVLESLAELPDLVADLSNRLQRGEKP